MEKINGKHLHDNEKPEILYVYDPLCGWCYGFSAVILKLREERGTKADIMVLSGGMITGDRIGPIGEVAPYIKEAYPVVEQTTGVRFGEKFLKEVLQPGTAIFSSEPPAKALAAFRLLAPDKALDFACLLQKAIYHDGIDVFDNQAYVNIAKSLGVESALFTRNMEDPEIQTIIQNEFAMVRGLGVSAYPTVLLKNGEHTTLLSTGWLTYDELVSRLQKEW